MCVLKYITANEASILHSSGRFRLLISRKRDLGEASTAEQRATKWSTAEQRADTRSTCKAAATQSTAKPRAACNRSLYVYKNDKYELYNDIIYN